MEAVQRSTTEVMDDRRGTVAIVDPTSTGVHLLSDLVRRGLFAVAVWSRCMHGSKAYSAEAEVNERASLCETKDAVTSALRLAPPLEAVICGGDSGVVLADSLSEQLSLRTNGGANNRRNKHWQQSVVHCARMRACRTACGNFWNEEMAAVCAQALPVVVKLVDGTGSEGVRLCKSVPEAQAHVAHLMSSQIGAEGSSVQTTEVSASAVVVQEYLLGSEYVVDTVSRDGVHKVVMLWRYDKREANEVCS